MQQQSTSKLCFLSCPNSPSLAQQVPKRTRPQDLPTRHRTVLSACFRLLLQVARLSLFFAATPERGDCLHLAILTISNLFRPVIRKIYSTLFAGSPEHLELELHGMEAEWQDDSRGT